MSTESKCSDCGSKIPEGSMGGYCPKCLMGLADEATLDNDDSNPPPYPFSSLTEGGQVGNYELLEQIGEGGMGLVFKAVQLDLNREVALKFIRSGSRAGEKEIKRFQLEAQVAASLRHPNLVSVYEIGEHEEQFYFSMEYIEGRTLAEVVRNYSMPAEDAARLIKKIAEAVHYAHSNGVLHRDLKPGNIILDLHDEPNVTDFGLAKICDDYEGFTMTGDILGTPSYMSPEQAAGKATELGAPTDIYSLGAMLYELLTGHPPFQAETPLDTMRLVIDEPPIVPRRVNPNTPLDIQTICIKCLSKEPAQRYSTAQDLAEDLDRYLRHEPIQAKPIRRIERMALWSRRYPGLARLTVITSVLSIMLAVAAFIFREDTLDSNAASAFVTAKYIQMQLNDLKDDISLVAMECEHQRLLVDAESLKLTEFLREMSNQLNLSGAKWVDSTNTFHSLSLFDSKGKLLARWPEPEWPEGREWQFFNDRDHYQGATSNWHQALSPKPYVSRAFQSRTDNLQHRMDKFGISCGIGTAQNNRLEGVILATLTTETTQTLGIMEHHIALMTQVDPSDKLHGPFQEVLIAHPEMEADYEAIVIKETSVRNSGDRVGFYLDPARVRYPKYSGFWLAGIAPVADTPLIVIVQSRDRVMDAIATGGLVLTFLLLWVAFRKQRRRSHSKRSKDSIRPVV